jgi:hypothetical protein
MRVLLLLLLAACPKKSEPQEPTPPPPVDASADAAPTPMQTPQAGSTIRASAYAQNCTRDDECIGVFEGDACNPCRCAFNAIRVDAFPKYVGSRPVLGLPQARQCGADCRRAIGTAAKCEAGTCVLPP